jgi:hypothetical protein
MISDSTVSTNDVSNRSQNPMHQRVKSAIQNIAASMRSDVDNGRASSMEDTWNSPRQQQPPPVPPNDSEFRVNDRRATIPQWLLLFLIVQGGSIIWWAASTTMNQKYYEQDKIRIEQKFDREMQTLAQELRVIQLERQADKDRLRDVIRDEVTNQMLIVRARPNS